MNLIFEDNFNGTGTLVGRVTDSGGAWLDAYPEFADNPLPKLDVSSGVMTLQSAHRYADIKPSVSPLINFRLEADVVLGGVLADSASIDFGVKWGKTAGGGRLSGAYFAHARTGGTNNLLCSTNVNGRGSLIAPTASGEPGAYTFVVQRLSGEVKLFVNGTNVLTAPFISAEPADAELYVEIGLIMPATRPAYSVSAVRLLGSQPVLAGAFWTTLIGATETP